MRIRDYIFGKSRKPIKDIDAMPANIYGAKNRSSFIRDFNRFHGFIKYRIIYPCVIFAKKYMRSLFFKEIPDEPHNKNLKILEKAWETSINDWVHNFIVPRQKIRGAPFDEERIKKFLESDKSVQMLRDIKSVGLSMVHADTAYREFVNILMHNISMSMYDAYKGQKVQHVMYTSDNIYDLQYFAIQQQLNGGKKDE